MKCSGKLSGIHLIILFVLSLFVSGCIVWETEEVKINLTSSKSGNVELTFGPIGSDEKEKPERERDYSLLLYDIIENSNPGNNYIKNVKSKLDKLGTGIYGKVTGEFDSLFALENNFDIQIYNGTFSRKVNSDEELISTNGKVANEEGSVRISWLREARTIEYKIRRKGSYMQPAYNKEDSFLPEYKVGVNDEKYYRGIYINHKLKSGNNALKKNEFRSAYGNFGDVLRIDPNNKPVKKEFSRLHFVPYLDAVGMIPLPYINISLGIEFNTASFDEDRFIDPYKKIENLREKLVGADKKEKAYYLCRLSSVTALVKGEELSSEEYFKKALKEYKTIENLDSLNPQNRYCYGTLLQREGNSVRAMEVYKKLAEDHPRYWPVYTRISGEYTSGLLPGGKNEFERWNKKGDDEVLNYLKEVGDPPPEEAFKIFRYMVIRNIVMIKLKNLNTVTTSPIDTYAYRMIKKAVSGQPDNHVYKGALGYSQTLMLTFKLFYLIEQVPTGMQNPFLAAIDSLNREMGDMIAEAKTNLEFTRQKRGHWTPRMAQNMAFLALIGKDYEKAEKLYIKSIELEPKNSDAYIRLTAFYNSIYRDDRGIELGKANKLLELLYNKISHSPKVIDRFLIGKLELHLSNIKKAYEQFKLAVEQDPGHYPSVVGFFKTKLLLFPEDAGSMLKEIDKFLAKEYSERETDELQFTKGVALALADKSSKAQAVLTSLLKSEGNRPVNGLVDALEVIRRQE